MVDANWEHWQNAAQDRHRLDVNGALRRATGINKDVNGICLELFGREANACYTEVLALLSTGAAVFPGAVGSYLSAPDAAGLDITGDIDVRVEFTRAGGGFGALIGKWNTTGNQRSWLLSPTLFSTVQAQWSVDGIAALNNGNMFDGARTGAYRWTLDVDDGAAGRVHTLYYAASLDDAWTQIGTATQAGVTSIFNSTAALELGSSSGGTATPWAGRITRAEVRSGIGGSVVASPDLRNLAPGTTSFNDAQGNTWSVNGAAVVV